MSLKKLIEEITKPLIDEMGIVAGDGTIQGSPSKKKVKKKFSGVLKRVSLMAKLGATFEEPITEEEEEEEDGDADEALNNPGNISSLGRSMTALTNKLCYH